jgi:hypothetical protein
VEETNIVVSATPFHCTTELLVKFVPFTLSENEPLPAVAEEGERLEIAGKGEFTGNDCGAEVPPPGDGFVTVTEAVLEPARFAAGTCAVS